MGDDEADEADDAAHGHGQGREQGGHGQEGLADAPDGTAEGLGRLVAEGEKVHVPGQPYRGEEAQGDPGGDRRRLAPFGELEAAEEPEDGLVVGIRAHEQEERGQGRGQRPGGDPGEEDGLDLEAAPPQGQGIDERDDPEARNESQEPGAGEAEGGGLEAQARSRRRPRATPPTRPRRRTDRPSDCGNSPGGWPRRGPGRPRRGRPERPGTGGGRGRSPTGRGPGC